MSGIFGGFLSIIDSIGGGILYIFIGASASNLGVATRLVRLVIGAVVFGAIVSLGIYLNSPNLAFQKLSFQNNAFLNDNAIPVIFVAPVAALVLTAVLELLSFALEYKPQRSEKKPRESSGLRITPKERLSASEPAATKHAT